jgi:hypothetical protein
MLKRDRKVFFVFYFEYFGFKIAKNISFFWFYEWSRFDKIAYLTSQKRFEVGFYFGKKTDLNAVCHKI